MWEAVVRWPQSGGNQDKLKSNKIGTDVLTMYGTETLSNSFKFSKLVNARAKGCPAPELYP